MSGPSAHRGRADGHIRVRRSGSILCRHRTRPDDGRVASNAFPCEDPGSPSPGLRRPGPGLPILARPASRFASRRACGPPWPALAAPLARPRGPSSRANPSPEPGRCPRGIVCNAKPDLTMASCRFDACRASRGREIGRCCPNDAREALGRCPIEGGDRLRLENDAARTSLDRPRLARAQGRGRRLPGKAAISASEPSPA